MPFDQGFDFRDTLAYVTDPAGSNFTFSDGYPITIGSATAGYDQGSPGTPIQTRNRNSGNDARIAGMHFSNSTAEMRFRVDLPSTGDYTIHLALGDASYSVDCYVEIQDTTTILSTVQGNTGAANSFLDATQTVYTAANWPGSETGILLTFTTTILRVRVGVQTPAKSGYLAYLRVVQAAAAGTLFAQTIL